MGPRVAEAEGDVPAARRRRRAAVGARILVVEAEALLRSSLTDVLESEGYVARSESDGRDVKAVAARFRPDLAILDMHFAVGPDGCVIARRLRRICDLPLVFVSSAGGPGQRKAAYGAGADDYLVAPVAREELVWRIRALLRRCGRACWPVGQVGDLVVEQARALRAGHVLDLTATEHRLLAVLARHAGQTLSKSELLAQTWGYEDYDPNLVEVHVSALRLKLEAHGPRLLHTVRGAGYVLRA